MEAQNKVPTAALEMQRMRSYGGAGQVPGRDMGEDMREVYAEESGAYI